MRYLIQRRPIKPQILLLTRRNHNKITFKNKRIVSALYCRHIRSQLALCEVGCSTQ